MVYSAALCLPHILCNSACLSCKNGFCVYLSLTRHIYCSRLEGIKSKLLNTLARLSSKDFFNPRRLSLHPLKGVYTPFSRGPFGTCPAFNRRHIGDICVPYGTRICSRPLLPQTCLRRRGFSHLPLRFLISPNGGGKCK